MSYIYGALILDVSRSHTPTQHSRYDSSGRVISSLQRPLPDNTRHSQQTNTHVPSGIRNHDISKRAPADLRLRPRGYWDRHDIWYMSLYIDDRLVCRWTGTPEGPQEVFQILHGCYYCPFIYLMPSDHIMWLHMGPGRSYAAARLHRLSGRDS